MHAVPAVVERLDRGAVLLGQVHRLDAVRGRPAGHRGGQPAVEVVAGLLDLDPLLLGERRRPLLRLLPGVGVAPALLRLGLVVLAVVRPEDLELLLGRELNSHGVGLQFLVDGRDHRLQPADPVGQELTLPSQVGAGARAGVGQDGRDVVEGEPEFPVEQDVPQPVQVRVGVPAIAGGRAVPGFQQADLAVVVQRPDRHTRQLGHLADRVTHAFFPSMTSGFCSPGRHRGWSLTWRQGQAGIQPVGWSRL